LAPTTTFVDPNVVVDWERPNQRGSPVTGYRIYFRTSDNVTFELENDDCYGLDHTIWDNTECTIPKLTFRGEPFNLPWGSHIYAYVIAFNVYGDSFPSEVGNGAIILVVPDAPLNLEEVYSERDATSLGMKWLEGLANGGAPVLDYQVSYDQATGNFIVLETGILATTFTAQGLESGLTY
jgi:hypothetical protein